MFLMEGLVMGVFLLYLTTGVALIASVLSHLLIRRRGVAWCVTTCSTVGAVWIPVLFVFRSDLTEEGFWELFLGGGLTALVIALVACTLLTGKGVSKRSIWTRLRRQLSELRK